MHYTYHDWKISSLSLSLSALTAAISRISQTLLFSHTFDVARIKKWSVLVLELERYSRICMAGGDMSRNVVLCA